MSLDLKGAGTALSAMGTAVGRIDFKTMKEEVGGLIKGFANLAKAILANPILLLAGVIAVVVMNMDKLRKIMPELDSAMGGLTEQMKAAAKANEASLKSKQSEYDIIMASSALMKEQGMTEKEILKAQQDKAKALLEQKKVTDAQNIANAKADLQRNENLKLVLKGIQEFGLAIPKLMAFVFDAVFAKSKELLSYVGITIDSTFQAYDTIAGAQQVVLDAIFGNTEEEKQAIIEMEQQAALSQTQLANTIAQTNIDIKKSDADLLKSKEQNKEKDVKSTEKTIEDKKKLEEEFNQFFTEWENELIEEEEKNNIKKYELRQKEIERREQQFQELQRLQSTALENEINDAVLAAEKLQELAVGNAELEIAIQEDLESKIAEISNKYRQADIDATKKTEEEKQALRMKSIESNFEMAELAVGALMSLNDAAAKGDEASQRKTFERNKLMQKAQATIAMASGIVQQLAVPQDQLTGSNFVKAAALAAAGIANIVKINQTQFGGASGGGGGGVNAPSGGGGTTAPSPANFAFLGMQPNQQQPPLQAYVVSTQVSSNLEAQQLIQNQSRLGG